MQTIYLDISNRGVIPTIYAKQGDVGRKFEVVLTDSGLPYIPVGGSSFSVWYSGASCEGNYTDIGDKSAFTVSGNKVIVEMISQMLSNDGDGVLSLVLNDPNGNQISTWNIPYFCEPVPGAKSEGAKDYYTAFSKSVEKLSNTEEILKNKLSVDGSNSMTADLPMGGHKVTGLSEPISNGDAINLGFANENYRAANWLPTIAEIGAAPAGYGLGETAQGTYITTASDLDSIKKNGWYALCADYNITIAGYANSFFTLEVAMFNDIYGRQTVHMASDGSVTRICNNGTWGEWEWENPPMSLGVEYRTIERWDGKPVYTQLVNLGAITSSMSSSVTISGITALIRAVPILNNAVCTDWDKYSGVNENNNFYFCPEKNTTGVIFYIHCGTFREGKNLKAQIWYTK